MCVKIADNFHSSYIGPYTDMMRFPTYCVDVTKYVPHTDYNRNPNYIVVKEVLGIEGHLMAPTYSSLKQ